jgi:two-component system, chemotaxis family, sensor kinase CheA
MQKKKKDLEKKSNESVSNSIDVVQEKPKVDDETKSLLNDFVAEAMDSLDKNEPLVEQLANSDNQEVVNTIFRVFHTIKGLSGFFGLNVVSEFTHEAETLLDILRKNKIAKDEETLDLIYKSFDFLRLLVTEISENFSDVALESDSVVIRKSLRSKILQLNPESEKESDEVVTNNSVILTTSTPEVNKSENEISIEEYLGKFESEANELIAISEKNLLELEKDLQNSNAINTTFASIHSLKGNAGFMGLKNVEKLCMQMETILDDMRSDTIDAGPELITYLLSQLDILKGTIQESIAGMGSKGDKKTEITKEEKPQKIKKEQEKAIQEKEEKPVIIIEDKKSSKPSAKSDAPDAESQSKTEINASAMQRKDIRVDMVKLDKLFDLVGELITIETMVTNNPDLAGLELQSFTKAANMMNKITRELQEITMSIRMTPLDGLFNKMKRLVRDLSIKSGKKINFEVSGQETEMDKNVIEEISDPLVHILRNAIDHGIETSDKRVNKGKSDIGNVSLTAKYEGNEILIIIEDDGNGLNKEKIIEKAIAKDLLKTTPDKLSDREVWNLIFEPGFSTADKITEVSGRGVGMDVVRRNIEKLRGTVNIDSKTGKGSRFVLRIPLTLAIMDGMLIRIGNTKYAIPIVSICESFRPKREDITITMDGLEVVKVRDEIFPVLRLHEIYEIQQDVSDLCEGILILVESHEKKACFFVDEILGQQQTVVKALSDYIGRVNGITGCFILSDGAIGLIIDVDNLMQMAEG